MEKKLFTIFKKMANKKLIELANKYIDSKLYESAEKVINKILDVDKNNVIALEKLSYIYLNTERYEIGVELLERACKSNKSSAEANFYLGKIYYEFSDYENSKIYLEKALNYSEIGKFYEGLYYLGLTLASLEKYRDAIFTFTDALKIKPNCVSCFYHIGLCLEQLKDYEKSLVAFQHAYEINPDFDFLIGAILKIKLTIGNWEDFKKYKESLLKNIKLDKFAITPLYLMCIDDNPNNQLITAKKWNQHQIAKHFPISTPSIKKIEKKIRIGYFSPDFRQHAVSYLIAGLIEKHNRNIFEVYAFSFRADNSNMRDRLKQTFDKFIDLEKMSDKETVSLAKKMNIDIAVDLGGYTQFTRPSIFHSRVAPIQINYLGYPGTMGSECYDYILADKIIIPETDHKYFSERVLYLECYQPNDHKRYKPSGTTTRAEYGLPDNKIIYCCFCNNFKITPTLFESWCRILKRTENTVLWLLEDNSVFKLNIIKHAISTGIDPQRLIFAPRVNTPEHLERLSLADICLDTFPYNGHTTSSDSLWCRIPIITIQGNSFSNRVTSSLLSYINMSELITKTYEEYENLAVFFASNKNISEIKHALKEKILISNLFNIDYFTKNIENIYCKIHKEHQ